MPLFSAGQLDLASTLSIINNPLVFALLFGIPLGVFAHLLWVEAMKRGPFNYVHLVQKVNDQYREVGLRRVHIKEKIVNVGKNRSFLIPEKLSTFFLSLGHAHIFVDIDRAIPFSFKIEEIQDKLEVKNKKGEITQKAESHVDVTGSAPKNPTSQGTRLYVKNEFLKQALAAAKERATGDTGAVVLIIAIVAGFAIGALVMQVWHPGLVPYNAPVSGPGVTTTITSVTTA